MANYSSYNLQPNFKPVDSLYEDRLRQFTDTSGQYSQLNLPKFYDIDRKDTSTPYVKLKYFRVPDKNGKTQRPLFREIDWSRINWEDTSKGQSFGPSWKTFWFYIELEIPQEWLDSEVPAVDFEWDCGNEGLIYSESGLPLKAFSGNNERISYSIKDYWKKKVHRFYLEIACNDMFGNGSDGHPDPDRYFQLTKSDLVAPNLTARKLRYDFWLISDAAREFPASFPQRWQANRVCNEIMDAFDAENVESLNKCREIASTYLGDEVDSDAVYFNDRKPDVVAVGNCHIDTAWYWPFAETRRKAVRSWTTQLRIAEQYPEYVFVASQMQQFKWLKKDHPMIFNEIKDKFTINQFLPIGGSWVENDTNIPDGESLIRQFLLGQRFQMDEFGFYSDIFWLPDTFGYSSQIPQLCQIVGIDKFLTQKLSWNNINQFPLTTFNWVGIDRSQVLVHMPPDNTYTADANFGDVMRAQLQHKNLRDVHTGLLLYGKGDGGGGPTEEMLEKLRRCRGISNEQGLLPKVQLGQTVGDFYENLLEGSDNGRKLPTWTSEMYLEFHRGTYTTQALVKRYMRKNEIKLRELEFLATLISLTKKDYSYPKKEIKGLWENLCLCQFHDVLPGSCIGMVYREEVLPMLDNLAKTADTLIEEALKPFEGASASRSNLFTLNILPWARNEVAEIDESTQPLLANLLGHDVAIKSGNNKKRFSVTSYANYSVVHEIDNLAYPAEAYKEGEDFVLTNSKVKATISKDGILTSLVDLVNDREVIDITTTEETDSGGKIGGNQFILLDDTPLNFPAWDTELYSQKNYKFLKNGNVTILKNSKLESSIQVRTPISQKSSIETVISIQGLPNVLDIPLNNFVKFSCKVDWHETYKFLKVQFPTTIYTAQQANYETQFGLTSRPTHYNTSWDVAKFEVCHHKFMDLSEHNYGVSVLNDCKYGGSIHGNLIKLSLLRAPKAPDDEADMGEHYFEYALFPHSGALGMDTVKLAHNFNHKISRFGPSGSLASLMLAIKILSSSIVLSQVKRSEDDSDVTTHKNIPVKNKGKKSFIIRLYEALGGSDKATISLEKSLLPVDAVYKCNALEQEKEEISVADNEFSLTMTGFKVETFKVVLSC